MTLPLQLQILLLSSPNDRLEVETIQTQLTIDQVFLLDCLPSNLSLLGFILGLLSFWHEWIGIVIWLLIHIDHGHILSLFCKHFDFYFDLSL